MLIIIDCFSIPQVAKSVFPGWERWGGVDVVLVFAGKNGKESWTVLLDSRQLDIGVLHAHEVFVPIGIEHNLASGASTHVDNDIYARLQFKDEFYAVLSGAQREIRHFFVEGGAGFCIE